MRIKQAGVTLIEVLLVLAIGAGILFFSLRQYESFRADADAMQLQGNVDMLLGAAAQFYFANCYGSYDANRTPPLIPGALHPNSSPANPFPVDIQTKLVEGGYLRSSPFPFNPIVNSGASTNIFEGYVVQLNRTQQTKVVCTRGTNATGVTTATGCTANANAGTIITWKPQVSILVRDTDKVSAYKSLLNADCASSLNGSAVSPCSANRPGDYLVWERLPSFPTRAANSPLWESNMNTSQFKALYTSYPKGYITGAGGTASPDSQTQYYLCGG